MKIWFASPESKDPLVSYGGALIALALAAGFFLYGEIQGVSLLSENSLSRAPWPNEWWPALALSGFEVRVLLLGKWLLGLLGATSFLLGRWRLGWWSLFFGVIVQLLIYSLDRRTMGNYHFMPILMALAFLFFEKRLVLCSWLLAGFYLGAGLLKLNSEWLSGSAFPGHWFDPAVRTYLFGDGLKVFQLGTHFSVLLELSIVFLLFSSTVLVRWLAFFCFLLFHGLSYLAVGWFYPFVMACLLPLFPLNWAYSRTLHFEPSIFPTKGGKVFLGLFLLAQILPLLYEHDPALSRRYGLFALNMFDSNSACVGRVYIRKENEGYWLRLENQGLAVRIQCEPPLLRSRANSWCSSLEGEGFFYLRSRRSNDSYFRFSEEDKLPCGSSP
jgi:hypothetical protein